VTKFDVSRFLKSFFAGLENASGTGRKPLRGTEIKSFMDLISSLKQDLPLSIPLLRSLAALSSGKSREPDLLQRRIERRYRRICKISSELGRLDFRKAGPGMSPEDYVFSQIDFSWYKKIEEKEFDTLFPEGLADFSEAFYKRNFSIGRDETETVIKESYRKEENFYIIQRENPLILSIMRSLDTSLESVNLFTTEELRGELNNLLDFVEEEKSRKKLLAGMERFYHLLVSGLDGKNIIHEDGMTTTLFIRPTGDLSGTFRPGNKPWTLVLIPAK